MNETSFNDESAGLGDVRPLAAVCVLLLPVSVPVSLDLILRECVRLWVGGCRWLCNFSITQGLVWPFPGFVLGLS